MNQVDSKVPLTCGNGGHGGTGDGGGTANGGNGGNGNAGNNFCGENGGSGDIAVGTGSVP
jgi:hypothetical protein